MEGFTSKVLQGLSLISTSNIETVTLITLGHFDLPLKCAFYNAVTRGAVPATEADLDTPQVLFGLENLKARFRGTIQQVFRMAEQHDRMVAEQERNAMLAEMQKTNKPHEMGTVAEIAAKYGISKSEVRRMKQEGTLETLALRELTEA